MGRVGGMSRKALNSAAPRRGSLRRVETNLTISRDSNDEDYDQPLYPLPAGPAYAVDPPNLIYSINVAPLLGPPKILYCRGGKHFGGQDGPLRGQDGPLKSSI